MQEVTVRILPPGGKRFRFKPVDTFSLSASVDFNTRACNSMFVSRLSVRYSKVYSRLSLR